MGAAAGKLTVIAFAPGDGTGDTGTYPLHSIDTAEFPHKSKIIPRSKVAVHTEGHLAIATWPIDEPQAYPALFAGNQLLLGLHRQRVITEGGLGQHRTHFQALLAGGELGVPTATYTVGYDREGERYADPHSVYNPHPEALQVCGFLAIAPEAAELHQQLFQELNMQRPMSARLA